MLTHFTDLLEEKLLEAKHHSKTIESIDGDGNIPIKTNLSELTRLDTVHPGINNFYKKINDGWSVKWDSKKYGSFGGNIKLVEAKYLFIDPTDNGIYYNEGNNEELQYYHIFDISSPETSVGFIIKPNEIYNSLYYLTSDNELYDLDLDYEGYTQMALEARVFNYWQKVLLYYMGEITTGAFETERFKTEMPKIFPDWDWDNFIDKFESLRLSNK